MVGLATPRTHRPTMASPRRVKPVHPLSGALAADARMSHRDMQILAPKVRVPHRTRPLATNLRPLRKHIGGTSADGTGARMRPLPIKLIDCFDHAVQLGSVHRRPGAWIAATDRSPARAGLHLSRPRCGPTGTTSCPAWTREPTAPDRFDVYQLCQRARRHQRGVVEPPGNRRPACSTWGC